MSRNTAIVLGVVLLHGAVLWAVQSGLMRRVAEVVIPAEILVEIMAPAAPSKAPPPAPQPTQQPKSVNKTATNKQPAPTTPTPEATPQPVPTPLAVAPSANAPAPSAAAPTAVANAGSNQSANGSSNAPAAPPAAPAPPKLELPSLDADCMNNTKPTYPAISKRLRETGLVVVRVFINTDGQVSQASIEQSSGFARLDQASLETALKLRCEPDKKAGVPQGKWYAAPYNWQLTR